MNRNDIINISKLVPINEGVDQQMDPKTKLEAFKKDFKQLLLNHPDILIYGDRGSNKMTADLHAFVISSNGNVSERLTDNNVLAY